MDKLNYENERVYLATINILQLMLNQSLISLEEYFEADKIFKEKYKPIFSHIFTEL